MTSIETGNIRFFTFFFSTKLIKLVVFFVTSQKRRKIKHALLSKKNIDNVGRSVNIFLSVVSNILRPLSLVG